MLGLRLIYVSKVCVCVGGGGGGGGGEYWYSVFHE